MTINESDSYHLSSPQINQEDELEITESNQSLAKVEPEKKQVSAQSSLKTSIFKEISAFFSDNSSIQVLITPRILLFTSLSMAITLISIVINNSWLGILGTLATLLLSLLILYPWWQDIIQEWFSPEDRKVFVGLIGLIVAIIGLFRFTNLGHSLLLWGKRINWEASGTLAEWFGALGQIAIAIIAVYVAWRQYVISKDLTIQQNLLTVQQNVITQQQTIDSYFQGVSDLILDEEGLLEDWPQERAIAEGRTAAIFSSVDGSGKAKILRFLSRSKLLTPLQRDRRLGRAILDGTGGYAEDRLEGVRVIDLGVMLAGADLADNDLRWTDLSEANLVRANLSNCDLVKANLSRTILYEANLSNTDLNGVRLFYGLVEQASPRSRTQPPNYETGEHTGAVIENADFTNAQRMSPATHYYCCAWCGEKTRNTIPGGCEGIPNKLGR
ncbi:pentapeptide repeat-containing protein [Dolichospermum circinale CS-545/17]|nr:pentapeptide repeat-containing protein [Dolichospermum circinale CS-545/17]